MCFSHETCLHAICTGWIFDIKIVVNVEVNML